MITDELDYVELHAHSYYSLLDGASSPETLAAKAAEFDMRALAVIDHDAVYGAVAFQKAAQQYGIKPIFGTELTLTGDHHLTLLVENATGWSNLCALITAARHNAPKGEAILPIGLLEAHTDGLIALSGCQKGIIPAALQRGDHTLAFETARHYQQLFQDRFYVELQNHQLPEDDGRILQLSQLGEGLGIPCVATNNVHYAEQAEHELQDILVSIRHNCTLAEARAFRRPNSTYFLKSTTQMQALFPIQHEALRNTLRIAERCNFQLDSGLQTLPIFPTPFDLSAFAYLEQLCLEGLHRRGITADEEVLNQLQHELTIIDRSGLANYFLIVWDVVRFANTQGILCQGRGSAANSLVAYLLHISAINPLDHNLVFERFLSDERQVTPDIDIDFDAARREEVIQYVYQRYGHAHAAMACTFFTFQTRSALRDVGKALGLPSALLERLADFGVDDSARELMAQNVDRQTWLHLLNLSRQIMGYPRHLGIHSGGMVVMGVPLSERLPTEPAKMKDRYVVQWDKDSLEGSKLLKIDFLGLGILAMFSEADALIKQLGYKGIDSILSFDDPAVFAIIQAGDTIGIFQAESTAQRQLVMRVRPSTLLHLAITNAVIRPGPVIAGFVRPLAMRWLGKEPVTYMHPLLEPILQDTFGVLLYQEQVLQIAEQIAGFTRGQGELLRRVLGAKNAAEKIDAFYDAFIEGAKRNEVSEADAIQIFETLRAFGSYSFPRSHAASFAILTYISAWIKCYHPAAFYIGLLNNQPMGFWSPAVLVRDAKHHHLQVLPVDVNQSSSKCTLEDGAIRLGYNYIKGFGDVAIEQVMNARTLGEFTTLHDFCSRTQLPRRLVRHLIQAGGMDRWGRRRKLLWELGKLDTRPNTLPLLLEEDELVFSEASPLYVMSKEIEMLGVSVREHPLTYYRSQFQARRILSSREVEHCDTGTHVSVAGMLLIDQSPPTAKGFHFLTLDDEFGFINVILKPQLYTRFQLLLQNTSLLFVEGRVQQDDGVTNIIATKIISGLSHR